MKCVGLSQTIDSKYSDIFVFGNNGSVQKADADSGCDQGFDRNEAADGYRSEKVVQLISGGGQPLLKNAARTGALFPDDNRFPQQVLNCDLLSA